MKPELLAETMDGETVQWMKRIASLKKIILTGSLIIEDEGKYFNRLIWMLPSGEDRKSTRLNSSHRCISYAVFCLKKKKNIKHLMLLVTFYFFNHTATTKIYTLSLHDALPIYEAGITCRNNGWRNRAVDETNCIIKKNNSDRKFDN